MTYKNFHFMLISFHEARSPFKSLNKQQKKTQNKTEIISTSLIFDAQLKNESNGYY
jgi:hypothetical protein